MEYSVSGSIMAIGISILTGKPKNNLIKVSMKFVKVFMMSIYGY